MQKRRKKSQMFLQRGFSSFKNSSVVTVLELSPQTTEIEQVKVEEPVQSRPNLKRMRTTLHMGRKQRKRSQ